MAAFIADFGRNEQGINLFRVNGTEKEIHQAITELKKIGCLICDEIQIEKAYKESSVLLKIKIPDAKLLKKAK